MTTAAVRVDGAATVVPVAILAPTAAYCPQCSPELLGSRLVRVLARWLLGSHAVYKKRSALPARSGKVLAEGAFKTACRSDPWQRRASNRIELQINVFAGRTNAGVPDQPSVVG